MSKIGIGVGEDFPVQDATPGDPDGNDAERHHCRRRYVLHVLTRIVLIGLIIAAIFWMFSPHYFHGGPYASLAPYRYHPYPHHFFFPFFPLLLIALFAFAWRRRGCYRHHHHRHDGRRHVYREEA